MRTNHFSSCKHHIKEVSNLQATISFVQSRNNIRMTSIRKNEAYVPNSPLPATLTFIARIQGWVCTQLNPRQKTLKCVALCVELGPQNTVWKTTIFSFFLATGSMHLGQKVNLFCSDHDFCRWGISQVYPGLQLSHWNHPPKNFRFRARGHFLGLTPVFGRFWPSTR